MFKQGFLDDVYKERPVKPVVTRFPPEPNGTWSHGDVCLLDMAGVVILTDLASRISSHRPFQGVRVSLTISAVPGC